MEIAGIPLHPLIVHAAVVFAPLAALAGLVYAGLPSWRWASRWPLVALTLLAVLSAIGATVTGEALLESRPGLEELPKVETHQDAGELLRNVLLVFTVVAGLAAWRIGGPSGLASGRGARRPGGARDAVLAVLLALAAAAVLVTAVLAGHSGAVAVWG